MEYVRSKPGISVRTLDLRQSFALGENPAGHEFHDGSLTFSFRRYEVNRPAGN